MKRRRIREIALASQTRFAVTAALWLSLFAYAGRPLLAGAAAAGLTPALGWTILLVAALLPALPMLSGARSSIHGLDFLKNEHRVIERGAAKLVMAAQVPRSRFQETRFFVFASYELAMTCILL